MVPQVCGEPWAAEKHQTSSPTGMDQDRKGMANAWEKELDPKALPGPQQRARAAPTLLFSLRFLTCRMRSGRINSTCPFTCQGC